MGYLKRHCVRCGRKIYLKQDGDGIWRPYKSWVAGDVDEGTWELHQCGVASSSAEQSPVLPKVGIQTAVPPLPPRVLLIRTLMTEYGVSITDAIEIINKVKTMIFEAEMSAPGDDDVIGCDF